MQNIVIGGNNRARAVLEMEQLHEKNCSKMQRMQDRVTVAVKLRHTCSQQQQVITNLEALICSNRGVRLDRATTTESLAYCSLLTRNRELYLQAQVKQESGSGSSGTAFFPSCFPLSSSQCAFTS